MLRPLFVFILAFYAFSALDLHRWVHVPQSIVHWLEHHTDFGHKDEEGPVHHHQHGDHDPFGCEEHGPFTTFTNPGHVQEPDALVLIAPSAPMVAVAVDDARALSAYSGSKWNPPKLG